MGDAWCYFAQERLLGFVEGGLWEELEMLSVPRKAN